MYLESNTPSAVIKSQEIDGLEEWLKNNKPTVIPPGVSLGEVKFVINKKAKQYPNTYPFQYKCHKCKYEYAAELKKKRREVAKAKQAMI